MSAPLPRSRAAWPLAAMVLLLGGTALIMALLADRGARTNPNDPGPWFLPLMLGAALCAGAAALFLTRTSPANTPADQPAAIDPLSWQLLGGLVVYVWALPWIGFLLSTSLFAWLLLWRLQVRWWKALCAAAGLTLIAAGLFSGVFKVPLPAGVLFP